MNIIAILENIISKHKEIINEGELRCKELARYLEKSNYPRAVFLSEDGSGVEEKIVHESRTNQLVGLVLPLNSTTGMPQLFTYKAKSAEEIKEFMEKPQSNLVYVIMAQPLQKGAPAFILQLFGTNNKFTAADVSKRWQYTENELKK